MSAAFYAVGGSARPRGNSRFPWGTFSIEGIILWLWLDARPGEMRCWRKVHVWQTRHIMNDSMKDCPINLSAASSILSP